MRKLMLLVCLIAAIGLSSCTTSLTHEAQGLRTELTALNANLSNMRQQLDGVEKMRAELEKIRKILFRVALSFGVKPEDLEKMALEH